jgi:tRNA dimethylallyltransferase
MTPYFRVLTGPTAAGKTRWLIALARQRPVLAISADSRQVYRHMSIGTGKPSPATLRILPHQGVDVADPGTRFSVYQFLTIAAGALRDAQLAGREPWVIGGAGLYIRALVEGLKLGAPPRPALRQALHEWIARSSSREVARDLGLNLTEIDNPVRVVRAAECACADADAAARIYGLAGLPPRLCAGDVEPVSGTDAVMSALAAWRCAGIAVLDPGRVELKRLIDARVREMFACGLLDEVAALRKLGFGDAPQVRDGIAYREAGWVLDGRLALDEAISLACIRTRQYAKRQRTYFRGRGWTVMDMAQLTAWEQATRGA